MKRTLAFMAFAFVVLATPAHAQQDGGWEPKNKKVHATGEATDGTCPPEEFPLEFDIHFGPGNKVVTAKGDQTTKGTFDPQTGKIKTLNEQEKKILTPDGKSGLKGAYTYENCRWDVTLELDKPGLAFAQTEPAAESPASPTAAQEAPAGAVGADQQEEGDGIPVWVPIVVVVVGGSVFIYKRLQPTPEPPLPDETVECGLCEERFAFKDLNEVFFDHTKGRGGGRCPSCDEGIRYERERPKASTKGGTTGAGSSPTSETGTPKAPDPNPSKEPDLLDEIDPPGVIS